MEIFRDPNKVEKCLTGYRAEPSCHNISGTSRRATSVVMRIMGVQWGTLSWVVIRGIYTVSECDTLTSREEERGHRFYLYRDRAHAC